MGGDPPRRGVTVLECDGLGRVFGRGRRRRVALEAMSLRAGPGEIIGVIGPNGAGKTTLLRLLAGELRATSGSARVGGVDVLSTAARARVGYASDPPLIPAELTGIEWLSYLASHRAPTARARIDLVRHAVELAELAAFGGARVATYSRGMAQRLALAAAVLCGSALVLLDETLSGMDPLVHHHLRRALAALAADGRVIVLASHDLGTVERLATRAVVLVRGRVATEASVGWLLAGRVLELSLPGAARAGGDWILERFRGGIRTDEGVAVPLRSGVSAEQVFAACREQRIAIAASRVRCERLEDVLLEAVRRC